MKITRISLRDFRAFAGPENYVIDLGQGRNLLLYGENGSGKSSLFEALRGLFNHRTPARFKDEYVNVFTDVDDGFVSVDISHANPDEYRWDCNESAPGPNAGNQFLDIARRAVFLDYRTLLKTHFVHRDAKGINLFDLLVGTVLADVDFGDGRSVARHWEDLQGITEDQPDDDPPPPDWDRHASVRSAAENFRNQLHAFLHTPTENQDSLLAEANRLLEKFDPGLKIELDVANSFCPPRSSFSWKNRFRRSGVTLKVIYAGHTPLHPAHFLNEARLTAIALSLFLSAAKLGRPQSVGGSTLRLLVLDDVLIGLDLAHRLPLLKLLEEEFADWQLLVFTHDLTWFEMTRQQVDDQKWVICELFCERRDGEAHERPVLRQGGVEGFLKRARAHLQAGEKRAAAVYARAAFEEKFRKYCSNKSIKMPFKANPNQVDGEMFLNAAEARIKAQGLWSLFGAQFHRLRMVRKVILNPMSHSNLVNLLTPEITDAIEAVEGLKLSTPEAHPSTDECRQLLGAALVPAIKAAATRIGANLPDITDEEVQKAIEQIEKMSFDERGAKPALEVARNLAAEPATDGNKLQLGACLKAAFEYSLLNFVIKKQCKLPFKRYWASVTTSELWEAAKVHQKLQAATALPFVQAVDTADHTAVLLQPLDPAHIQSTSWDSLRAILNTLEANTPAMSYTFQTKLDVF